MPDRHSMPLRPASIVRETTPSQGSPAATVTVVASIAIPRVATCTTAPGKPSSATTRLLPPPRISSGPSHLVTAEISSSSLVAVTNSAAGPPRPSVVWSASFTLLASNQADDGAGPGQHLGAVLACRDLDHHVVGIGLLGGNRAGDLDRRALIVIGDHDHGRETHAEFDYPARIPVGQFGDVTARLGHRVHAVRDNVRQADRL